MKEIRLSNRLSTIAELAGSSDCVADVGTDHGYVPIRLLSTGSTRHVIASDVNPEPLEHARMTAIEYEAEGGIDFVLSDGLSHLKRGSADTIIIAGMGGETIADILSRADWIRDEGLKFVLQPMTKTGELIKFLFDNGLYIKDARLSEDAGEIYLIILAAAGKMKEPTASGYIIPEKLLENKDPLLSRYLSVWINRISYAVGGLKSAKAGRNSERLNELQKVLEELISLKEDYRAKS
jgi:Predicted SAM-dependent methyltransferase